MELIYLRWSLSLLSIYYFIFKWNTIDTTIAVLWCSVFFHFVSNLLWQYLSLTQHASAGLWLLCAVRGWSGNCVGNFWVLTFPWLPSSVIKCLLWWPVLSGDGHKVIVSPGMLHYLELLGWGWRKYLSSWSPCSCHYLFSDWSEGGGNFGLGCPLQLVRPHYSY